ncbi:hypothetical protein F5888DRAFT_1885667 [Russula emetica]|nr:hypothetical protein F5888DRAFT_1885667 [Russula emetica]
MATVTRWTPSLPLQNVSQSPLWLGSTVDCAQVRTLPESLCPFCHTLSSIRACTTHEKHEEELLGWTISLTVVGNVTTTTAAFLSDGTLAWRFRDSTSSLIRRSGLYLPAASVILNAPPGRLLHEELYEKTLLPVTLKITVDWGWFIFFASSLMTSGIIYKIIWANRTVKNLRQNGRKNCRKYATASALRAVIESALATWIGILLFEIALLAPSGHVTGISQCLITARLGIVRETRNMNTIDCYASQPESQRQLTAPAFKVFTNVTTIADSQDFQVEIEESKTMNGVVGC